MDNYVYILSNSAMPGFFKIGKTTRKPDDRSIELYTTGVPSPFEIEISFEVENCDKSEKEIFQCLKEYRYSANREFFYGISLESIIDKIVPILGNFSVHSQSRQFNVALLRTKIDEEKKAEVEKRKEYREKERILEEFLRSQYQARYLPLVESLNIIKSYNDDIKKREREKRSRFWNKSYVTLLNIYKEDRNYRSWVELKTLEVFRLNRGAVEFTIEGLKLHKELFGVSLGSISGASIFGHDLYHPPVKNSYCELFYRKQWMDVYKVDSLYSDVSMAELSHSLACVLEESQHNSEKILRENSFLIAQLNKIRLLKSEEDNYHSAEES